MTNQNLQESQLHMVRDSCAGRSEAMGAKPKSDHGASGQVKPQSRPNQPPHLRSNAGMANFVIHVMKQYQIDCRSLCTLTLVKPC